MLSSIKKSKVGVHAMNHVASHRKHQTFLFFMLYLIRAFHNVILFLYLVNEN